MEFTSNLFPTNLHRQMLCSYVNLDIFVLTQHHDGANKHLRVVQNVFKKKYPNIDEIVTHKR